MYKIKKDLLWPGFDGDILKAVLVVMHIISMFISFIGNVFVSSVIIRNRKLRHQPAYMLILSVSLADLCVTVIGQPLIIEKFLHSKVTDYPNEYLDNISFVLIWGFCCVSGFGVLFITIDRYIYIEYPLHYPTIITHKRSYYLVMLQWILGILYGATPLFYKNQTLTTGGCLITLVLINIFMVFVYYRIQNSIKKQKQRKGKNVKSNQITITIMLIVLAFCGCWYPYVITSFAITFINETPASVPTAIFYFGLTLGCINSSCNVCIYGRKNKTLKDEVFYLVGWKTRETTAEIPFYVAYRKNGTTTTTFSPAGYSLPVMKNLKLNMPDTSGNTNVTICDIQRQ